MARRGIVVGGTVVLACLLVGSVVGLAGKRSPAGAVPPPADQTLRLAGEHTFTGPDPAATWELHRLDGDDNSDRGDNDDGGGDNNDDDDGGDADRHAPLDTATGASVTFDLPAREDGATTYEVRSGDGAQRITVFPADTVTRLDAAHPDVRTYAVVPSTLSRATHVLLVMHGQGRDAEEYCESWVDWAAEADYVVLCPEFTEDDWAGSAGYNLGNVFAGDDGAGAVHPEDEWAFTVAEQVHRYADSGFGLDDTLFDMWGHSAGGQFVHRFVLFKPESAVRYALAANAGWYTVPDPATDIPYGLRHPELDLGATVAREHLVLMRGEEDVVRDDNVRTDPGAEAQGATRYERAGFAHAAARAADPDTNWQLLDVPGADHDQVAMSAAAQRFLLDPDPRLPYTCPLPDADPCPGQPRG